MRKVAPGAWGLGLWLLVLLVFCACHSVRPTTPDVKGDRLSLRGELSQTLLLAEQNTTLLAELEIAVEPASEGGEPPVNLALVIDTSGSMEGKAIAEARASSLRMLDTLKDGDRLAVVTFGSSTELLLPSTELDGDSRSEARDKISEMRASGTTDMATGLELGLSELRKHTVSDGVNRIVLLGDGVPNNESRVREAAARAAAEGISITSLGLGEDYNESLMGAIAQQTGGKFHFIEQPEQVAKFLAEEVLRLHQLSARRVTLELVPGPGAKIDDVVGQSVVNDGTTARVDLGDFSRGDRRKLVVRLSGIAGRDGRPVELADAVLSYDPASGERVTKRVFLGAHASKSSRLVTTSKNRGIEVRAAVVMAAAATVKALDLARAGDRLAAQKLLRETADAVERVGREYHRSTLVDEAERLRGLVEDLPAPAPVVSSPSPAKLGGLAPAAPRPQAVLENKRRHDRALEQLQ